RHPPAASREGAGAGERPGADDRMAEGIVPGGGDVRLLRLVEQSDVLGGPGTLGDPGPLGDAGPLGGLLVARAGGGAHFLPFSAPAEPPSWDSAAMNASWGTST